LKVLKYQAKDEALKVIERLQFRLDSVKNNSTRSLKLKKYFLEDFDWLKSWCSSDLTDKKNSDWFIQNIKILEQMTNNYHFSQRDSYMRDNVEWIVDQNPSLKVILWGHNGHIKKSDKAMGKYLNDKYKKKYLSIGFAFHEGEYTAKGKSGIKSYAAQTSEPGTNEFFFNSIDEPILLLDLRNLDKNQQNQKWLSWSIRFRQTGGLKVDEEFYETNINSNFDIIIFISKSYDTNLLQTANRT